MTSRGIEDASKYPDYICRLDHWGNDAGVDADKASAGCHTESNKLCSGGMALAFGNRSRDKHPTGSETQVTRFRTPGSKRHLFPHVDEALLN